MQKISPFLWFDDKAEEAAIFYTSVFKNSKIGTTTRYDEFSAKASGQPVGSVLTVGFQLHGQDFTAINGGPAHKFTEAISFAVTCRDQDEIDYYWKNLTADGGKENVCGWLWDKYGLSWQVVPENISELISSPGATSALMQMKKIIISDLEAASGK